jgi:hypothetical protein
MRYFSESIKAYTRLQRAGSSNVHKLVKEMPAPARQQVLSNTKSKVQLNAMLVESLLNSDFFFNATQTHSMTLAGVNDAPIQISRGVRIDRHDLPSKHEEADVIIAQHAISSSILGSSVNVVCDDTDVFVSPQLAPIRILLKIY